MLRLATNSRTEKRSTQRSAQASTFWRMLVIPRPVEASVGKALEGLSHELIVTSAATNKLRLRLDAADDLVRRVGATHCLLHWTEAVGWHTQPTDAGPSEADPREATDAKVAGADSSELSELLAEAAHDIRSPLASAQQILNYVGGRAKLGQALSGGDLAMLNAAASRLVQADRWAEAILVERNLRERRNGGVRRRFYPHQWRNSVEPLLQDIAQRHTVKLNWVGWDRSLPKLYLDSNRLSRIVLNLVTNAMEASHIDGEVTIRVGWQVDTTPSLTLSIEDTGIGLDQQLIQEINSTESPTAPSNFTHGLRRPGLGLRTAKLLARSMGVSLTATIGTTGGSLLRLTLPVDNPPLLIRNWLNAQPLMNEANPCTVTMHSIVASQTAAFADQQLQQAASSDEFVYRVSIDRWLWLSVTPIAEVGKVPSALQATAARITRLGRQTASDANCQVELLYSHVFPGAALDRAVHSENLRRFASDLCEQFELQLAGRVPRIDQLDPESNSALKPLNAGPNNRVRCDTAEDTLLKPRAVRKLSKDPAQSAVSGQITTTRASQANREQAAAAFAISDVARQWSAIQRKLSKLQSLQNASMSMNNAAAS
jgi:signal transduction histidine kinase